MKSAKKLRKSSGILSNEPKRIGKVLDEDVQKLQLSWRIEKTGKYFCFNK